MHQFLTTLFKTKPVKTGRRNYYLTFKKNCDTVNLITVCRLKTQSKKLLRITNYEKKENLKIQARKNLLSDLAETHNKANEEC